MSRHRRHVGKRSGPHALGIFLEPVFPVGRVDALPAGQVVDNLLDLSVPHYGAHPDAPHVVEWNHDLKTAGGYFQKVELLDRGTDRPAADLFDDADAVVRINDLVADVEIQVRTAHV